MLSTCRKQFYLNPRLVYQRLLLGFSLIAIKFIFHVIWVWISFFIGLYVIFSSLKLARILIVDIYDDHLILQENLTGKWRSCAYQEIRQVRKNNNTLLISLQKEQRKINIEFPCRLLRKKDRELLLKLLRARVSNNYRKTLSDW
ncbi:MAG: hypothetical protein KIT27_04665 [Legionellales bacterium]|nr:hypothetical protein [Legionellales bacterium]